MHRNTCSLFQMPSQIVRTYIPTSSCAGRQPDHRKPAHSLHRDPTAAEGPAPCSLPAKAELFMQTKRQSMGNFVSFLRLARSLPGDRGPGVPQRVPKAPRRMSPFSRSQRKEQSRGTHSRQLERSGR